MTHPAEQLRQAALIAYDPDHAMQREEALFRAIAEVVTESDNMTLPEWSPIQFRNGRKVSVVHGYEFDEDFESLTLIRVVDAHKRTELGDPWEREACTIAELEAAISDMKALIAATTDERLPELDEGDPANRLVEYLKLFIPDRIDRITLCTWTTGTLSNTGWQRSESEEIRTEVWDASRLGRAMTSGSEPIEIDFRDYGGGISFILDDGEVDSSKVSAGTVLVGKIPGDCLADIYFRHRTRVLQQNVRAFLSISTKVNGGMLKTIRSEPHRFLAFNNGIATTASSVEVERIAKGVYRLVSAKDFQIVNGGQTTATLLYARFEKKSDLGAVSVPMKLTVVRQQDLEDLVPLISRYANTQNKVQDSDFDANDPWLVKLEEISRKIEASKDSKSAGQRIRWYFERVRGQYNVDLGVLKTSAQKAGFKASNPARTRFNKTELAVAALSWDLEPFASSLGPQKCFGQFSKRLKEARSAAKEGAVCEPSDEDFRRICCILLLRREAMRLCREIGISPQLSSSAVSSYAIARIAVEMKGALAWGEIWSAQEVPSIIEKALRIAIKGCEHVILDAAHGKGKLPSEYAKKPECWSDVASAAMQLGLSGRHHPGVDRFSIMDAVKPKELVMADGIFFSLSKKQWQLIASALALHHKNSTYSGCATTMSKDVDKQKKPTPKQARILAKGLFFLRDRSLCSEVLEGISDDTWRILEQIT
jgi:hypothetical protein